MPQAIQPRRNSTTRAPVAEDAAGAVAEPAPRCPTRASAPPPMQSRKTPAPASVRSTKGRSMVRSVLICTIACRITATTTKSSPMESMGAPYDPPTGASWLRCLDPAESAHGERGTRDAGGSKGCMVHSNEAGASSPGVSLRLPGSGISARSGRGGRYGLTALIKLI